MAKSISYYITLFVIKCKNIKKDFSQDPINYNKIRKSDVQNPSCKFYKNTNIHKFKIFETKITSITNPNSQKLIFYIHGGAFVSGPSKHHWETLKTIYKSTHQNIWMVNYPKAPEHKIDSILENITHAYTKALQKYKSNKIIVIGDSAGATLALVLKKYWDDNKIPLPQKTISICPVIDPSLSNPQIERFDKTDPILSKKGVKSAKLMCALNNNLNSPMLSPKVLPHKYFKDTVFFLAQNDILYPDAYQLIQNLKQNNIPIQTIIGYGMPHIWPLLPVMKESKLALKQIIAQL